MHQDLKKKTEKEYKRIENLTKERKETLKNIKRRKKLYRGKQEEQKKKKDKKGIADNKRLLIEERVKINEMRLIENEKK